MKLEDENENVDLSPVCSRPQGLRWVSSTSLFALRSTTLIRKILQLDPSWLLRGADLVQPRC
jgi:hypothetical protein